MRLIIFRHGIAIDRAHPECPPDPERMLTEKGIARARAAAQGLCALGVAPVAIYSSPYRRALETATIAAEALDFKPAKIETTDALLFDRDPEEFLSLVRRHERDVVCTGHAPHLDELLSRALGVRVSISKLKKAGAAAVGFEFSSERGRLEWVLTPRALRALGGA